MKRFRIPALALLLAMLAGCAEYKEYTYKEFSVSREQAYTAMMSILSDEGYEIRDKEENYVNDLPEIYVDTEWNMAQTGSPYAGNDFRRRAYIKITTVYSERKPFEYQPLTEAEAKRWAEQQEKDGKKTEAEKKADLEQTRIGVAVRLERRSDIKRPLEADWYYEGPDNYEVGVLLGRFEAAYGTSKTGGTVSPSGKSQKMYRDELERRQGQK
ncbi:MAG: hypothetical protein KDB90_11875 [Planctomycetes bacterium]|nr:hypothetical protein [Planctomycetota bacterium]